MLAGSIFVFIRSLRRVALNAALSAAASAFFVLSFLGALPIEDADTLLRFLAHVASAVSAFLAYLMFAILGLWRQRELRRRTFQALAALAAAVMLAGWLMPPQQALRLSLAMAYLLNLMALSLSMRSAWRGDRQAWVAVSGLFFMLVSVAGLGWIALDRAHVPWQVHVVSAVAGTAYLATMSSVLWMRYAYLIELHQVMAYGPSYDPVTRMRSHSGTATMVGAAFRRYRDEPVPLGVIVVSIANLPVLEKLYGPAAMNHALFICAGRLRRVVPAHVEMGRLAGDGFLLLMRNCRDSGLLLQLARTVQACLAKPVVLKTSLESTPLGEPQTHWAAEVGVGAHRVSRSDIRASAAVTMGRDMSRTAWTYPSRVVWYDERSGEVVGMPELVS